jgi:hypothetical protein
MALGFIHPLTEMSTRNCFWGIECSRCIRLTSPLSVSWLPRLCGILNILQLYRPPLAKHNFYYMTRGCNVRYGVLTAVIIKSSIFWNITLYKSLKAIYLSLPWVTPIQFTPPHSISPIFMLILSTYLHLGLPSGLFASDFPTNNLYAFLFSPFMLYVPSISSSLTWLF